MRTGYIHTGDTLEGITIRNYYVYDDQGDLDKERISLVASDLIKWNADLLAFPPPENDKKIDPLKALWISNSRPAAPQAIGNGMVALMRHASRNIYDWMLTPASAAVKQPPIRSDTVPTELDGSPILLPDVADIPPWGPAKSRLHARNRWYAFLYIFGLVAGLALSLAKESGTLWPTYGQLPALFSRLALGFQRFITAPADLLQDASPWLIAWSVGVGVTWLYRSPAIMPPFRRMRLRYTLGWGVGLFLLPALSYILVHTILPVAAPEVLRFTSLAPLVAIWTTVVFMIYLYRGDGSENHRELLARYNGVWAVFGLVVLLTFLSGYSAYLGIRARVEGDLSIQTLLHGTMLDLQSSTRETLNAAADINVAADINATSETTTTQKLTEQTRALDYIVNKLPDLKQNAASAHMRAQAALRQIQGAIDIDIEKAKAGHPTKVLPALLQIKEVLNETISSTNTLMPAVTAIEGQTTKIQSMLPQATTTVTLTALMRDLRTAIKQKLLTPAQDANMKATVATASLEGIKLPGLALFLWIGFFYAVFVLFPWMLLLLFIFKRRTNRAKQILEDIQLLDPHGGLLKRAMGITTVSKKDRRLMRSVAAMKPALAESTTAPDEAAEPTIETQADVIEALAVQAFSNFEYILSLLLLSLITAVGWYYVFYPDTSLGLANMIEGGSGVKELSDNIVIKLTPLTMGFVGAYFFLMQMLVRRYLAGDLYPAAFLQSAQRLLLVFILSLALGVLTPILPLAMPIVAMTLAAFFAGIFPNWGLRFISMRLSKLTKWKVPNTTEIAQLTNLDGLSVWTEARLFEENVENIQSLATAPIEQLVLKTHFSTTQLVDWIDQSILYIHSGHKGEWFPLFRAVGIRTASDLLDSVGFKLPAANRHVDSSNERIDQVVVAVAAAQAACIPLCAAGTSRALVRAQICELLKTIDQAAGIAAKQDRQIQSIAANNPSTYDHVTALRQVVQAASAQTAAAEALVPDILGTSVPLLSTADQQAATISVAAATTALQQAQARAEAAIQTSATMTLQPSTLSDLSALKQGMPEWGQQIAAALTANEQLINTLAGVNNAQPEILQAQERAKQVRATLKLAQDAVQAASDQAQGLDAARPETLDARLQLRAELRALSDLARGLGDQHDKLATSARAIAPSDAHTEIDAKLAEARKGIDGLDDPAKQAAAAIDALIVEDATLPTLPSAQKAIAQLDQAYQRAQAAIGAAIIAVRTNALPRELTAPILEQICYAMWPDPNVRYVLNFYQNYGKPDTKASHTPA